MNLIAAVSENQVRRAREVDLISYLQAHEPNELIRDGPGRYITATHDSLVISNGKWKWNSRGVGGATALDFLIKVRGVGFVEAVEHLSGERAVYVPDRKSAGVPEKRSLSLPWQERFPNHAVPYLQKRGIHSNVITRCIKAGILYEGKYRDSPVCVFVGRDKHGEARFSAMRGIYSDDKRDARGSDKRYGFFIPAKEEMSKNLAVFEAPIDAMSHASMQERGKWDWDGYRLSLGGTSPTALLRFLEAHPWVKNINLHLDNDRAGISAAVRIKLMLSEDERFSHMEVKIKPPSRANDYNAVLCADIEHERNKRQKARFEPTR